MRRHLAAALVSVLVVLVAVAAACGDRGAEPLAIGTVPNTATTPIPTTAPPKICVAATDVPEAAGKPKVDVPVGPAPSQLVQTDLTVGTGAEATAGSKVKVQYVGVACTTGKQFDSSWDKGTPFEFTLGQSEVIPGWDQGVVGMKVGGRRQLVIPANLAYGAKGKGDIGPNEPLVFVIDLLDVQAATASSTTAPAGASTTAPATTAPAAGGETTTVAPGS